MEEKQYSVAPSVSSEQRFVASIYPRAFPRRGQYVIGEVVSSQDITDYGATITLLGYVKRTTLAPAQGFMVASDKSRQRKGTVQRLLRLKTQVVYKVLQVDVDKECLDLERSTQLSEEERQKHFDAFQGWRMVYNAFVQSSRRRRHITKGEANTPQDLEQLTQDLSVLYGWLWKHYESTLDVITPLQVLDMLKQLPTVFLPPPLPADVLTSLVAVIQQMFPPRQVLIQARLVMLSSGVQGVDDIKSFFSSVKDQGFTIRVYGQGTTKSESIPRTYYVISREAPEQESPTYVSTLNHWLTEVAMVHVDPQGQHLQPVPAYAGLQACIMDLASVRNPSSDTPSNLDECTLDQIESDSEEGDSEDE